MLRQITLHGPLETLAGIRSFEFDVDTPVMLVSALRSQIPGFRQFCDDHKVAFVTTDGTGEPTALTQEDLALTLGSATDIHIIPEVEGAGFGGELILAAWAAGNYVAVATYIAVNIAIAVVTGMVISALAPSPDMGGGAAKADEKPSFIYNGAVNVIEQGYAIPLVYGTHMTGSIVVSAGITVEDIPYVAAQEAPPANGGGTAQPTIPDREAYQWGA